jgi:putative DNA primase/helicase
MNPHAQFIDAAALAGLHIDSVESGRMVRVKVDSDRGAKRSGTYRFFDDDNPTGIWWNWKTGTTGVWVARERMPAAEAVAHRERMRLAKIQRDADQAKQWQMNAIANAAMFAKAQPLSANDPVARYLASRGLAAPQTEGLRYAPALPYWHDGQMVELYPAMLAEVRRLDGKVVAIHRTYLTPDGRKADLPTVKKLTGTSGALAGAAIWLGSPHIRPDGQPGLAVAEGIETALAVTAIHGIGCWAAVSAHGMTTFEWPDGVRNLYVMGDNDESNTGQQAADKLAKRAAAKGLTARVHIPRETGHDWADVWADMRRAKA